MANLPNTLLELTEGQYNELRYDSAGSAITGEFVEQLIVLIEQCGVQFDNTGHELNTYDEPVVEAVKGFQTLVGISPATGILGNGTYQSMLYYAQRLSDVVYDESGELTSSDSDISKSPHYASFFKTDAFKQFRKNHVDIKIIFGNDSIVKTIKDAHMRSVTVEVDTSGNPISEVYEFIARDLVESDEISDANKYVGTNSAAPSDIKYIYHFSGSESEGSSGESNPNDTSSDSGRGGGFGSGGRGGGFGGGGGFGSGDRIGDLNGGGGFGSNG